jgi:anti-sigma B factor antagonist
MEINEWKIGANIILQILDTRFGADKAASFKEAVGRHLDGSSAAVVLDLSNVVFMDSSGLGAIVSVLKRMPKGCELIICGMTDHVSSMFKLTRLDRVFTVRKNVDEALSTLSVD